MTDPILNTPTEPARMSPVTRWVRTALQVLVAVGAAIPSATVLFDLPATTTAKLSAFAGALVVAVSALHNAWNSAHAKS